jgi:hypothetical protein
MPARLDLAGARAGRRRAQLVAGRRGLRPPTPAAPVPEDATAERCDLCQTTVPDDHRHMLNMHERQIVCVCESCWALRSGDPEFRPVGTRTAWLEGFRMPEEIWASFRIPIGLSFFMHSSSTGGIVALYPSPAGATESELSLETWTELCKLNPVLEELEQDSEALIVNRLSDPPAYAIAPIDRCYMLVGLVKVSWEGISGGPGVEEAVSRVFGELRAGAMAA